MPELEGLIRLVAGNLVSFEKTGPMQVGLIVPSTISTTNLLRLTTAINTRRVDDEYAVPYPATLNISGYIVFIPTNFFAFDRVTLNAGIPGVGRAKEPVWEKTMALSGIQRTFADILDSIWGKMPDEHSHAAGFRHCLP